ncbi:MAG: hypothetical protein IT210_10385 [Armatimonadetes bacterium]|nr:hypothetical protein [Armatimonadota bacterium]
MNMRFWLAAVFLTLVGGLALRAFYKPHIGGNAPEEAPRPAVYRPRVVEGDKSPDIELADLNGKKRSLKAFRANKPVMVWFFAPT